MENYNYDLDAGIYRLSAELNNYNGKNFCDMDPEELENSFMNAIFHAKRLPLPPETISVFEKSIMFDWHFDEDVIIKTQAEMEILIENFTKYIEQIPFGTFVLQRGMFCDDPNPVNERLNAYRKVFGVRNTFVPVSIKLQDIAPVDASVAVHDLRR